jgi:Arc/MetJ-type ribon-helix-helix transcriptional regulator
MPKSPIYKKPRTNVSVKIYTEDYEKLEERFKMKGYRSYSAYIQQLVTDDLILAEIEKKQKMIEEQKRRTLNK